MSPQELPAGAGPGADHGARPGPERHIGRAPNRSEAHHVHEHEIPVHPTAAGACAGNEGRRSDAAPRAAGVASEQLDRLGCGARTGSEDFAPTVSG